jgi:riboflavin synthase
MFTGIVEEVGRVKQVRADGLTITAAKVMADLAPSGSISVNGACLTVTSRDDQPFSVDLVPETLRPTNLGSLDAGGPVNLRRPLAATGRLVSWRSLGSVLP